jgi:rhodanese-related sulfurtransferase
MPAKTWRLVAVQAIVLIGVGSAIAVIDSFRRPITLTRAVTPEPAIPPTPIPAPSPAPGSSDAPAAPPAALKPGDAGWTPTPKDRLPAGQVTIDEAKALFDAGAAFIDTRKKEEYETGHVQNAFRIALSNFRTGDPALLGMISRSQSVVVYCNGGQCDESEAVARMLAGSGYSKVYVLHDGFPGWKAVGHPVQTGAGVQAE